MFFGYTLVEIKDFYVAHLRALCLLALACAFCSCGYFVKLAIASLSFVNSIILRRYRSAIVKAQRFADLALAYAFYSCEIKDFYVVHLRSTCSSLVQRNRRRTSHSKPSTSLAKLVARLARFGYKKMGRYKPQNCLELRIAGSMKKINYIFIYSCF